MSQHNTLFTQTLSLISIHTFQKLENRHKIGRSSRKFGFKEQFTVMAFIQLAARRSMRDSLRFLADATSRLYHWGLKNVARSTFADANNSRPVGFFQGLFGEMVTLCQPCAQTQISLQVQNCSAWTPPPSSSACHSFPRHHFARARAALKCTPSLIMMAISRLLSLLPMPLLTKAVWPKPWS